MQVILPFAIYKTTSQHPWLEHQWNKASKKTGIHGKVIADGVAEQQANGEVVCYFLAAIRTELKICGHLAPTIFATFLGRHWFGFR